MIRRYFQCSESNQEENLQVPCEGKKKIETTPEVNLFNIQLAIFILLYTKARSQLLISNIVSQ